MLVIVTLLLISCESVTSNPSVHQLKMEYYSLITHTAIMYDKELDREVQLVYDSNLFVVSESAVILNQNATYLFYYNDGLYYKL